MPTLLPVLFTHSASPFCSFSCSAQGQTPSFFHLPQPRTMLLGVPFPYVLSQEDAQLSVSEHESSSCSMLLLGPDGPLVHAQVHIPSQKRGEVISELLTPVSPAVTTIPHMPSTLQRTKPHVTEERAAPALPNICVSLSLWMRKQLVLPK